MPHICTCRGSERCGRHHCCNWLLMVLRSTTINQIHTNVTDGLIAFPTTPNPNLASSVPHRAGSPFQKLILHRRFHMQCKIWGASKEILHLRNGFLQDLGASKTSQKCDANDTAGPQILQTRRCKIFLKPPNLADTTLQRRNRKNKGCIADARFGDSRRPGPKSWMGSPGPPWPNYEVY